MGLFAGIDATHQSKAVKDAAARIVAAVEEKQRNRTAGRWSIAELDLCDDDINWLLHWARTLRPNSAEFCLKWSSYSPTFGLLFLAIAAEVCRRESDEASAFPTIRGLGWSVETQTVLFNSQGHINTLVAQSIDAACRRYDLRHVLDATDKRRWFTTIKLQFGMTRTGMNEQLHKWLYFQTLPSVAKILLDKDSLNFSDSFESVVTALDAFQDRFRDEHDLRKTLSQSPWILNSWIDELVDVARQHPRPLGYQGGMIAETHLPVDLNDEDEQDKSSDLFSPPTLKWDDDGTVSFYVSMLPAIDSRCADGRFFVAVDDENQALFVRQGDGQFARMGSDHRQIALNASAASHVVSLNNSQSEPIAVTLINLYENDQDVLAWKLGQHGFAPVDGDDHRFESAGSYTLCIPNDATIVPETAVAGRYSSGNRTWIRLDHHWPEELRILLDEVEIFSGANIAQTKTDADWTNRVSVTHRNVNWDANTLVLQITTPANCELIGVRVGGNPVGLHHESSTSTRTSALPIELGEAGQMDVRLCVAADGERRIVRRTPKLEFAGLLVHRDGRWQPHLHGDTINIGELRRKRCRVQPPTNGNGEHGETDRSWIAVQGNHSVSIPMDVGGWGQGLKFVLGKYNRPAFYQPRPLASKVVDQGAILDCICLSTGDDVLIRLQDPLEPSPEYQVVVWTDSGEVIAIASKDIRTDHDAKQWLFSRHAGGLDFQGQIIAVGVAFRGTRIGSWWVDDWFDRVVHLMDTDDVSELAAMLRWLRIPVLESKTLAPMKELVCKNAVAFASVWLADRRLETPQVETESTSILASRSLVMPSADIAWYSVIRILFSAWEPSSEEANQLANSIAEASQQAPGSLDPIVQRMAEAAPMLVGKLVHGCLSNRQDPPKMKELWLNSVADEIRPPERSEAECYVKDDRTKRVRQVDRRVKGLNLSEPFVDQMLRTAREVSDGLEVPTHDRENLRALLQHPNFSRLVVAHLLESLAPFEQKIHVPT